VAKVAKIFIKVAVENEICVLTKPFTDAGSRDKVARMAKMAVNFLKKFVFVFKISRKVFLFYLKMSSHSSHFSHFPSQTCMNTGFQ